MAGNIGKLSVELTAEISKFKSKLEEAEKAATGAKDRISASLGNISNNLSGLALPATLAGTALLAFSKKAIDAADKLDEMSERTGVSVESLNGLSYAMKLSGGDAGELEKGLQTLNKKLSDFSAGDESTTKLFKSLGITAADAEGALLQLADVFPKMSKQDQVRIGSELLGKAYQALVPLLAQGREGLQGLIEEGQRLNPVTAENAKKAAEFNDALDKLNTAAQGAALVFSSTLLPSITNIVEEMLTGIQTAGSFTNALKLHGLQTDPFKSSSQTIKEKQQEVKDMTALVEKLNSTGANIGRIRNFGGPISTWNEGPLLTKAEAEQRLKDAQAIVDFQKAKQQREALADVGQYDDPRDIQNKRAIAAGNKPVYIRPSEAPKAPKSTTEKDTGPKNYAAMQEDLNKIIVKQIVDTDSLTEAEKRLNEFQTSAKWDTLTKAQKAEVVTRTEAIAAIEKQKLATDSFIKVMDDASLSEKQAQLEMLGLTDAQKKLLTIQSSKEWGNYSIEQRQQIIATYDARDAADELRKSQTRLKELLTDSGLEQARSDMMLLADAFKEGTITKEQFNEAATRQLDLKAPLEEATDLVINLSTAMNDASTKMADSMIAFAASGKASFGDMTRSILADIAKMIVQQMIFNAIKMGMNSMAGSGGILGSIGVAFGGKAAPVPSANGNVFGRGSLIPFATGGVVSQPTYFPMANGGTGLMGEAGVEGVFPLTRVNGKLGISAAGAGSTVNNSTVNQVTVNVNGGNTNAETSQAVSEAVVRALAKKEIANQQQRGGLLNPMQIKSR